MNKETKTKVNDRVVMMAIRPFMLDVDIVPRGLDAPGVADAVASAMMEGGLR
jgi:hypothetical protein